MLGGGKTHAQLVGSHSEHGLQESGEHVVDSVARQEEVCRLVHVLDGLVRLVALPGPHT